MVPAAPELAAAVVDIAFTARRLAAADVSGPISAFDEVVPSFRDRAASPVRGKKTRRETSTYNRRDASSEDRLDEGHTGSTLADLGEFRLLNEVILPELKRASVELGDDCGFVDLPDNNSLVVTTDFAPKPLAWLLGHQSYRTWGWYAVLINASDLASAGADALGFTSSVEGPSTMDCEDLREFYAGMADACAEYALPYVGGNLRAAPRFECHGTAFGTVPTGQQIVRSGCRPGDVFVSIGPCGAFINSYMRAKLDGWDAISEKDRTTLLRPKPRLREMRVLRAEQVLSSASDNSDGVLGAIWNILERSGCGVELDLDAIQVPPDLAETAARAGVEPWNMFFFWGDWQVIATIKQPSYERFVSIATANDIPFTVLGAATAGDSRISARIAGDLQRVRLLRNENFSRSSFNEGVESHVAHMLRAPLFES